jgi:hypothetical protein
MAKRASPVVLHSAGAQLLCVLAELGYLTPAQAARVGQYKETSLPYVRKALAALATQGLARTLPRWHVTQPVVYTPTSNGCAYAAALGACPARRVRPGDERDKAKNVLYLAHTLAVTDVLIAAKLLTRTHPAIALTRLYTERSLKRKISVVLPDNRRRYIEPDASCEFTVTETMDGQPHTWQEFVHLEIYRHLPIKWRFQEKVWGYITSIDTGVHQRLFQTAALSIAVLCDTLTHARLLKQWTEEALTAMGRVDEGEGFFFCHMHTATAMPEAVFLSPVWEQAFGATKTPLLVLEAEPT